LRCSWRRDRARGSEGVTANDSRGVKGPRERGEREAEEGVVGAAAVGLVALDALLPLEGDQSVLDGADGSGRGVGVKQALRGRNVGNLDCGRGAQCTGE
jgi:hypothetical protein